MCFPALGAFFTILARHLRETELYQYPSLGPNLYVTPANAFTVFHEDGCGTVDSGHQVLSGYNRVIMLGRLTGTLRRKAQDIIFRKYSLLTYMLLI